ncbi:MULTISPECIES: beta-aspartyl-peptidase [unclassified Sedimentibacter]|uniref:beta-aspartyl-peptidase n=1 Tax=unclassified Sedimentibacter TaxID=2649220 RepID=UPI0027E0E7B6|nr:beta-aspartyl-peptidase [Sedimentibacter sp. MB35-C1]WMJ76309.1 beta-aspartyl-peptidase [Sedimentibacter sp. MB35-C1]
MILIKNIDMYTPKSIGVKDVLIINDKIVLIEDSIPKFNEKLKVIDGTGNKLIPGFVDNHVHITGGGGEGSFKTRVPEITLSKLIECGTTTVVGLLGTDSITRNVENLVAKAKSLKEEGISVYALTGSYGYPSTTITSSIKKDIAFIDEIIGVKIALSDHRSPSISCDELARLASDARVAGMISGKAGIVTAHMGNGDAGLRLVNEVLEKTEIPVKVIRPTHVNRKRELLLESFDYAKKGGIIDLTCGMSDEMSPSNVIIQAEKMGVPLENITVSSDGYGSWSNYDSAGNILEIGVSSVSSLYNEFKNMVSNLNFSIEDALPFFTTNVSKALEIYPKKGVVCENSDADVLIVNKEMDIVSVIAKGRLMLDNGKIMVKGTYE